MTENQNPNEKNSTGHETQDAWREVGRQFGVLGDSLASAFRAAWQDEANQQVLDQMRSGLETMVNKVGRALNDYASTPGGQQLRSDVRRAADNLRSSGEQTWNDARPHLSTALRQVNSELQRMIDQLESSPAEKTGSSEDHGPDNPPGSA